MTDYIRQTFNAQGCLLDESRLEVPEPMHPDRVLYRDAPPLPRNGARYTFRADHPGYALGRRLPPPGWARRGRVVHSRASETPLLNLAHRAALHYRARRRTLPPNQLLAIPVFPLGAAHNHTSNVFRDLLGQLLLVRDLESLKTHQLHINPPVPERIQRQQLTRCGYAFVDVDPVEWEPAPPID